VVGYPVKRRDGFRGHDAITGGPLDGFGQPWGGRSELLYQRLDPCVKQDILRDRGVVVAADLRPVAEVELLAREILCSVCH
jgi:hypothetical protein